MDRKPLEKWSHDSGRVTLLGDACHPMLVRSTYLFFSWVVSSAVPLKHTPFFFLSQPYRAQGAAMAIEDAAVLGNLLSRISHISQLGPLLKAYQDLRLERTASAQASSRGNQRVYHLPDGEVQKRRDENMKMSMAFGNTGNTAELWLPANQKVEPNKGPDQKLLGYDADVEVEKWWASNGKDLERLVQ